MSTTTPSLPNSPTQLSAPLKTPLQSSPVSSQKVSEKPAGGAKHDAGKTRIELFPGDALFAISEVLTFGAQKYDARNWELGLSWGRVFGAVQRHLWSWWQGKGPTNKSFLFGEVDTETAYSHLWHAGCCIVFLIAYEARGLTSYDDRPTKGGQV